MADSNLRSDWRSDGAIQAQRSMKDGDKFQTLTVEVPDFASWLHLLQLSWPAGACIITDCTERVIIKQNDQFKKVSLSKCVALQWEQSWLAGAPASSLGSYIYC